MIFTIAKKRASSFVRCSFFRLYYKDLCKGLLERLLHIEIADIEYPDREKAFKKSFYSHGVRLDVFVKNSNQIFTNTNKTAMKQTFNSENICEEATKRKSKSQEYSLRE